MSRKGGFLGRAAATAQYVLVCGAAALTASTAEAIDLKPGDAAPALHLTATDGRPVEIPGLNGVVQLLMFADSSHQLVLKTVGQIGSVFDDPALDSIEIRWVMIITDSSDPDRLLGMLDEPIRDRVVVVRDSNRHAFEAYEVFAVPAVAVIDGEGKVVRTHAGPNPRIEQMILEDLLVGAHRIDFEQLSEGEAPDSAPSPAAMRLQRLTRMAIQLYERGMFGPAERAFKQALAEAPGDHDANTGLGNLFLATGKPTEALACFQTALDTQPGSVHALLGIAAAELRRPGVDLPAMQTRLAAIRKDHPDEPRVYFLGGIVHERLGDCEKASALFKQASALLLGPVFVEELESSP